MSALYSTVGYCAYDSVLVIESITNHREHQQDMEALYLLMPTTENVDRIIEDFPTAVIEGPRGPRQPKYVDRHTDHWYKAAHVFFIEGMCLASRLLSRNLSAVKGLSEPLINKLTTSLYNRTEELHWLKDLRRDIYEDEYILKTYPPLFVNFWGTFICCLHQTDADVFSSHGGTNLFTESPGSLLRSVQSSTQGT
jgi:hypothetical protein